MKPQPLSWLLQWQHIHTPNLTCKQSIYSRMQRVCIPSTFENVWDIEQVLSVFLISAQTNCTYVHTNTQILYFLFPYKSLVFKWNRNNHCCQVNSRSPRTGRNKAFGPFLSQSGISGHSQESNSTCTHECCNKTFCSTKFSPQADDLLLRAKNHNSK